MELITTYTVVIDKNTGDELLNEEDMSLSLPEHGEVEALEGMTISIADREYIVLEANTEPKLNNECDLVGVYVFLRVAKKE